MTVWHYNFLDIWQCQMSKTKQADGSESNGSLCIENGILELGTVLTILNIQFSTRQASPYVFSISSAEMTETAWKALALIIWSVRFHSPLLGSNFRISSRKLPSGLYPPPEYVKFVKQFFSSNYCYLLPVMNTLWSTFAPLRPTRGVGSSPE